ncbi:8-O-methyltransferase [Kibdelosporangium banguiense]|uniref:8-O-methyltransferase n=1 Tax=Kibdelosporangium banguiense TaxID=1365924 RepID=A0ABS4TFD4_9PSEU|nr:methyltransferase [Kibdelosporangium banguiense]MBP2323132.1 8-O-methyltransferase [Kibdelosporangium banguiense]
MTGVADINGRDAIWRLGISFFGYHAMLTAAELNLFDLVHDKPATRDEITQSLDLHPRFTADFLDSLVAMGLLARTNELYTTTALSAEYFRTDSPTSIVRFFLGARRRWERLPEALKTGESQALRKPGSDMFTAAHRGAEAWRSLMSWFDYLGAMKNSQLAKDFDWSAVTDLVDAGGGSGTAAAHVVLENPHVRATVFDLPHAEPAFDARMAALGVNGQVTFRPGDFFTDRLPEADAILFSAVLHDWDTGQRDALLRNAFDALRPGGVVLVTNHMIDDDRRGKLSSLLVSINMMLVTPGGRGYTTGECQSWLRDAGFADTGVTQLGEFETLVTGRKPATTPQNT